MKQKDWEPERNEWCKVRWWVQAALGKVYSEGEGFRETRLLEDMGGFVFSSWETVN